MLARSAELRRRQNELTALQNRIQQLTPILETLPQSDDFPHSEETVLDNWRQVHEQCLALHSQQQTLQQQDVSWRRKVCKKPSGS